jgi:hypothetical protein
VDAPAPAGRRLLAAYAVAAYSVTTTNGSLASSLRATLGNAAALGTSLTAALQSSGDPSLSLVTGAAPAPPTEVSVVLAAEACPAGTYLDSISQACQACQSPLVTTAAGAVFGARVVAPAKYANFRLPFTAFRPLSRGAPPTVDGADVARVGLRFAPPPPSADPAPGGGAFRIELDRVKALPGGDEPDFVLLSCAGAGVAASAASPLASTDDAPDAATAAAAADRIVSAKRAGEAALRRTGLGYVIVRPGPLLEEPGGYRALVFDQGGRVRQPLACADAADVCLKALHDPLARNKAFDVGYEYAPDGGLTNFELVAHLPDKANNYLSPALAVLEKNT